MSQSFQPRMPSVGPKNTPITKIGTATIPFSQGLRYQSDTMEQPQEQQNENLVQEKTAQSVEPEITIPVVALPDFTYGRSLSTSFCMRCGGQAEYFGKSHKLNFSKKLCGDCVAYYSNSLNV